MKPTKICSFEGCDKPRRTKGLCNGHYEQQRKGKELRPLQPSSQGLTFEQRFWAKVNRGSPAGCWEWVGAKGGHGYGQIGVDGRKRYAHRVSWEIVNGPIPERMDLDHRCGNRACVNPAHLRIVTRSQNNQHRTVTNKNNASGIRGVSWDKRANAWRAHAVLNSSQYWGGYHSTIEAADKAARALRARLFTHDDHHEKWLKNQKEAA